jgi:hypothetical protein
MEQLAWLKRTLVGQLEEGQAEKKKEQIANACRTAQLDDVERELIIRWLLKDDRVVFGGKPIAGAPKR